MAEKLAVEDFHQFGGKHCQTAALKNIEDKVSFKGWKFGKGDPRSN